MARSAGGAMALRDGGRRGGGAAAASSATDKGGGGGRSRAATAAAAPSKRSVTAVRKVAGAGSQPRHRIMAPQAQ